MPIPQAGRSADGAGLYSTARSSDHSDEQVLGRRRALSLGEQFKEVLEAARLGAEWAWRALHRELAPGILSYLTARGASEPEDAAAEVIIAVFGMLPRFEGGEAEFRTLAFSIAHRRLVDDRRARRRRPERAPSEVLERVEDRSDVEGEAIEAVRTDEIRRMLGSLSADQQEVLLLRIVGGLNAEEVAEVVGKTAWAVRALQRRGLAALRRKITREAVQL